MLVLAQQWMALPALASHVQGLRPCGLLGVPEDVAKGDLCHTWH